MTAHPAVQSQLPDHPDWVSRVRVRLGVESDLPVLEWDGEFAHFRKVYADTFSRVQKGLALIWIADLPEEGLIGQAFTQLNCDRPELADGKMRVYLYSFRIKPLYRNSGLGARLLGTIEEYLRQRGFGTLTLNVAKENLAAQRFYWRNGFHTVASEPGIWSYPDQFGVWHQVEEPAWRMEKKLPGG